VSTSLPFSSLPLISNIISISEYTIEIIR
jgi:hypothetical protein